MPEQTVKVSVVGHMKSGKTRIARIVEEALKSYGFEVEVTDMDGPPRSPTRQDFGKGRTIEVEVIQTRQIPGLHGAH